MLENEPDKVEIIIIEGDSAGNTVEGARDYRFQCILPLKGKITNTYSASRDTLISSNEINEFLKVEFGTNDVKSIKKSLIAYINDGTDFYVKSKKIIVMSDADSDGKHIQNLFLAFVYTHLPEMIELGWIYIAKAPLYRVLVNKQYRYFMDDNDYNEFRSEIIAEKVKIHNKKWNVKRFMSKSQEFLDEYNRILNKFSIHPDILDWAMEVYNEEAYDLKLIEECGLDWNTNDDTSISIEGLYENIWHSFKLDELINEIEYLVTIYPFIETEVETIGQKEIEILSIHDSILYLSTFFRYTRNRLKGLGEMDADELKSTTLDPEVRSLIRVEKTDLDSEKDLFNIVFGNKTERRKDFLKELVFNMNE
jgi:DNA gyrase subunit B